MLTADIRAGEIRSRLGDNPVGVEVGVFRGGLSARLLMYPGLFLHMVDHWATADDGYLESGDYHATLTQEDQDGYYLDSLKNTEFAKDRRRVWRMPSVEAASHFEDGSLDFVFLDADHSYQGCAADIAAWRKKLKPDGILCGHDYDHPQFPKFGVKQAVDELGEDVEIGNDMTWFIYDPKPLTVVCVKWGTKYGPEYVNKLRDMVSGALTLRHRFVCLTDDPEGLDVETMPLPGDLEGWWNKVYLFKPGLFEGRVLYLDLDVCITGPLNELRGGIISDWHLPGYNSSVMAWEAGDHAEVWEKFTPEVAERMHGDQDWITELGGWSLFPEGWCVSYRSHAVAGPPEDSRVVCFHGTPKPHECDGWVKSCWGRHEVQFINSLNNPREVQLAQFRENMERDVPWFRVESAHDRIASLIGGGPSLSDTVSKIRGDVFALNNTHDWLINHGIMPKYHVMLDSRADNAAFVRSPLDSVKYLISAFCHPSVFEALEGYDVTLWMSDMDGVTPLLKGDYVLIGGGATVGLKTLYLAYLMGYRRFDVHGFDSCYRDGMNHAYKQPLNDGEQVIEITAAGRTFQCAPWMAKQAKEFQQQVRELMSRGCQITIHGSGLIPWIYQQPQQVSHANQ